MVGYNPSIHTKFNSCRILNENLVFEEKYLPVPFNPTEPYIKESQLAFIPIESENMYTIGDKSIITDNTIIEFKYEKDKFFKWVPLRIRDNLKPNDFITATNVWNSINNPISLDMITSGIIPDNDSLKNYYNRNVKRKDRTSNLMYNFHSMVKKNIIKDNLLGNKNLLDLSVGKAGDLNHWLDAKVNLCVGVDINKDNLINVDNGACNRIFNKITEIDDTKIAENTLMIWGDSSQDIVDGSGALDELHKYYLDIIYGNIDISEVTNGKLRTFYNIGSKKNGFDCVSCQFALHYFFKDESSLNNLLNNVSRSLKTGGRFIGTCLDGDIVFNELQKHNYITNDDSKKILSWKITKKYTNKTFNNDTTGLGLQIDVYHESIGASFPEYLVNFNYLITMCEKYNLKLVKIENFKTLFGNLSTVDFADILKMDDGLQKYSFMNNIFLFDKK